MAACPATAGRQSRDMDSPRERRVAASLRDTNSVKSRTRFVLPCLSLCEEPTVPYMCRSVPAPSPRGGRHRQRSTAVSYPEPLPYSNDLRLGVGGPEWNPRGANLTSLAPVRDSMNAYDDPTGGIRRARTPRG